jgi:hypothetical protein
MTTYLIHNADGNAVSVGTVVADPLPAGLTAVALSDTDAAKLNDGTGIWDATTLTVIDRPVAPPRPTVEDRLVALEAEVRTVKDRAAALEAASTRPDSRRN